MFTYCVSKYYDKYKASAGHVIKRENNCKYQRSLIS